MRPQRRTGFRIGAGLALFVLFVLAASAARAAVDCTECHDEGPAPASVHADLGCTDCHSDIEAYPHPEKRLSGDAICSQCHDVEPTLEKSVHGGVLGCQDCHGAGHDILPLDDLDSAMSPVKQPSTCGGCHETDDGLIDGYLESVHGRALLRSGLVTAAPSCSDCHGSHAIKPVDDPDSRVSHFHIPETCGHCHSAILAEWRGSAHGKIWEEGGDQGPVCMTCHSSHRVEPPRERKARLKTPETCGHCHEARFQSYRDSFHGEVTDLGFVTAAICSDCHTPHDNLPASDPDSSINPAHLAATCGQCHGAVSAKFLSFDPHAEPASPHANPTLHGIWLAMTILLVSVFAFFGLHDLLWFQRSAVALARGELAAERSKAGPWVRRFSPGQRRIHLVVILTFLTLAATGLPLKFHYLEWAHALVAYPGGVAMSRLLHRTAALLTFGYFLVHILMVAKRGVVNREPGLLWGWKSLVPRPKDLTDMWRNLKYFLYAGPRPRFDRWTYWEKFDYFAVFWGVAVIGASGLMLWFPKVFSQVLPGWLLNAAFIIHSDEALLAVGFIFVFHFFHTHLRPESFPLDPAIFVGAIPLERFKEERPEEYRRLVERGELDSRLVPAPPPEQLRKIRLWGFLAVAIGLSLVAGILWGFVH